MSSSVVVKALGLNLSPNALDLPNGSLSKASNVIIKRENVIEPRRGFKLYGTSFGTSDQRAKQLFAYKNRILRHYGTSIQYDADGTGNFLTFSGSYTEAQAGLRTRSIESNGNLYFTSSSGIKSISAASASDFTTNSGFITGAGVPKAIDLSLKKSLATSGAVGFLPQDSTVAYRTTWNIKDLNSNLKEGTPSQPIAIYVSLLDLLIPNLLSVLEGLDNVYISPTSTFFANYGNYVNTFKCSTSSSATTLYLNLLGLATQIDDDIRYAGSGSEPLVISAVAAQSASVVRITFSAGNPTTYFTNATNKKINLSGFGAGSTSTKSINGAQTVVNVTSTYIEFTYTGAGLTTSETFTPGNVRSGRYVAITQPAEPALTPTNQNLLDLQTYLQNIITDLQNELSVVIGSSNQSAFIAPLLITQDCNITLTIQIPKDVTANHFLQVYRSTTVTANGTDILNNLVANSEEMQLVYEAYPTADELIAKQMVVNDITPDIFKGANLYTNQSTGEGILQANDVPPFALDINKFKNYIFYANTKTRHRIIPFSLLGVSNLISDAQGGTVPTITVADTAGNSNTYTFVLGVSEVTTIACIIKSSIVDGSYFDINSANNVNKYRFWLYTSSAAAPSSGGRILVKIDLSKSTITSSTHVASRVRDVIASYVDDFNVTSSTNTVTVTNVDSGATTDGAAQTSGFTLTTTTQGSGENATNKQILLSQNTSVATAVDETARSLVRVINANSTETIYAYYISSIGQVPGKIVLESRSLSDIPFYLVSNNTNTGGSFFPAISPEVVLTTSAGRISVANPTVITSTSHGLANNDKIIITNSDSTPSINGAYTVTVTDSNTFSIPVHVTVAGTKLSYTKLVDAEVSQNETKTNRLYYSKLLQPEAVPLVNTLDIGAADKAILRIMPLRDSLFIFKEDGLFRISGENSASFYLSLFDSSCILIAPDSVSISNNIVYAFTRQGISTVSEAGVVTISRPIDTEILKISSSGYTSFETSTWGVGYESDNSYLVFTVQKPTDTSATIAYRYSNLTNTWTTFDKNNSCGIVNSYDDKLYLGAGDINYVEQERKSFSRLDYADHEITSTIANNSYSGNQMILSNISGLAIGDVVVQNQMLTPYRFNSLLQKLDIDPSVAVVNISAITVLGTTLTITANGHNVSASNADWITISNNSSVPNINGTYSATYVDANNFQIVVPTTLSVTSTDGQARLSYYNSLKASAGANLRNSIVNLAAKLDTDPGVSGTSYSSYIATKSGSITSIAVGTPTSVISSSHGLQSGRYIAISGSNSTPVIDGSWVVTNTGTNTFTIPDTINTAGTSGSFLTSDQDFNDIKGCFNIIVNTLNSDAGISFNNYKLIDNTTSVESIISSIDSITKKLILSNSLDFIVGPITIYKAIESDVIYSPNIMGDPLGIKQIREATIMFLNRAFSGATLSFATDLLPRFVPITFTTDGNGMFGSNSYGAGFFGGSSNSAPFRTIIPRNCQRCRFIVVQFTHQTARESYSIYGITLTGEVGQSTRAYR